MKLFCRIFLILLISASASILVPQEALAGTNKAKLTVVGSTTVLPVVSRAAEKFSKQHAVVITVNAGGSGVGVNSVGSSRADIGMISRAISDKEQKHFAGGNLRVHKIGRDAVACAISSEIYHAGVTALSKSQIRDIYLGVIRNWNEVGGPDRLIVVIDKERHRGTRHVFMKYILGDETARAPGSRLITGSNNEEQTKIAQSDSAIGLLSVAWLNDQVAGVGIISVGETIHPTLANIQSGKYPISRDLSLVTRGEPKGLAKKFLEYIISHDGQRIVADSGYVPITPTVELAQR
jgi:phosphate transport system substrate-binding protein